MVACHNVIHQKGKSAGIHRKLPEYRKDEFSLWEHSCPVIQSIFANAMFLKKVGFLSGKSSRCFGWMRLPAQTTKHTEYTQHTQPSHNVGLLYQAGKDLRGNPSGRAILSPCTPEGSMELPWKGRSEVTVGGCPEGAATYGSPSPSLSRPGGAARIAPHSRTPVPPFQGGGTWRGSAVCNGPSRAVAYG